MQRAGRQPRRLPAYLANSFLTKGDQFRMEWDRLNAPDSGPFHSTVLFARKTLACFARIAQHSCQNRGVQMALIESCFATPDHRSWNTGKRLDTPNGADCVLVIHSNGPDFKRELGGCCQRIAPGIHRCRTRVRLLTEKRNRVPLHALCAKHDCKRQTHTLKHRALLDVKL